MKPTKPNKKLKWIAILTPLFAFTLGLIPLLPTTIYNSTNPLLSCFNWSDRALSLICTATVTTEKLVFIKKHQLSFHKSYISTYAMALRI